MAKDLTAGMARFGFITDLLSKPVRLGYVNGIGHTMLIGQRPQLLGFSATGDNLIQETFSLMQGVLNGQTVSSGSIACAARSSSSRFI